MALSVGVTHKFSSNATFEIEIVLTETGVKHWEKVIEAIFQYAHKIKDAGPKTTLH